MADNDIPDLWPKDIAPQTVRTPLSILRAQATALGKRTRNILEGEVKTRTDKDGDILHDFYVVAPTFGGYRYRLFGIYHGPELYPVTILNHPDDGTELSDEAEFIAWLKKVLASPETQRLLSALKSQAVEGTPAA
jgi:hypothetical protein